jgi:hypothetical protein
VFATLINGSCLKVYRGRWGLSNIWCCFSVFYFHFFHLLYFVCLCVLPEFGHGSQKNLATLTEQETAKAENERNTNFDFISA